MVGVCRSLEQLDGDLIANLEDTVRSCVEGGNNNQMKEIRGLGDRLSGDQPQPPDCYLYICVCQVWSTCCWTPRRRCRSSRT